MRKGKQNLFLLGAMLSATLPAVAGDQGALLEQPKSWWSSYVASIALGPVWGNSSGAQTFFLQPNIEKTWTGNRSNNAIATGELFLGTHRLVNPKLDAQFGLAVATTGAANISGDIWDDAEARFDNFEYSYNIYHTHVAVKGKLIYDADLYVRPYVSASLGASFNTSTGYTSTPLIPEAITAPNFTNHTLTTFAYTLGIGVQKVVSNHWQVGLGYEFADWGRTQLGLAPGQTRGTGLTNNNFYTNGVMFNLTYLA